MLKDMKKISRNNAAVILFLLCAGLTLFPVCGQAAAAADSKAQADALRALIKENPDIVLDVLRDNSELVLDLVQQGSNQRRVKMLRAQWEKDITSNKAFQLSGRPARGNPDAPVVIVAYSDLTCSHCRQAEAVVSRLLNAYGDKVFFVFKPYIFKERALAREAAITVLAAFEQSQDKGWELYDKFFLEQQRLLDEGEKYVNLAALDVGLDMKRLQLDKKSSRLNKMLDEDYDEGKKNGVEGTPTFFVNGRYIPGAFPEDVFASAINQALENPQGRPAVSAKDFPALKK